MNEVAVPRLANKIIVGLQVPRLSGHAEVSLHFGDVDFKTINTEVLLSLLFEPLERSIFFFCILFNIKFVISMNIILYYAF